MRWDDVLVALNTELRASAALSAAFDGALKLYVYSAPRDPVIPCIALQFIGEAYRDSINDLEFQVTLFANSVAEMVAIERAVRDTIDRRVWSVLGGIYMRCELIGSIDIPDPEEGVVNRALDLGVSLARERYEADVVS